MERRLLGEIHLCRPPRAVETLDGSYIVTSEVSGNFQGSPVDLRYIFILERGKIASLEIAP